MMLARDQAIPGESLSVHSWLRSETMDRGRAYQLVEGYILLLFGLVAFVSAVFLLRLSFGVLRRSGYVEWWESLGVLPEGTPDVKTVAGADVYH
jgi:hypothetical protein